MENEMKEIEIFEAVTLDGSLARYAVIQDSTLNVAQWVKFQQYFVLLNHAKRLLVFRLS
jgi:hypothetical protein